MRTATRRAVTISIIGSLLLGALAACGSSTTGPQAATSAGASGNASAGASAAGFPVTVTAFGNNVTITHRPTAIISLSASATEMLYAVGAGDQVKAVDQYSNYPPQAPKTKLSGLEPNLESLIADKPDLVIIDADRSGLDKRLTSLGVPLLMLPAAAKLDDVYAELETVGTATGHASEGKQEATKVRTQIQRIAASVQQPAKPRTYYYELDPNYYSVTSDTFVGRVFALLGLKSIGDKAKDAVSAGGYPQLSAEYIIQADPDYIFLADTICCQASSASVAKRPGWSAITAVRKDQVVGLNDDIASRWGPRIVDLMQTVADAVEGKK